MTLFGPNPLEFFENVYDIGAPWDINAAQPAMADLITAFPPTGPLLDLGSGSGDLAIHLAHLGHQVIGVDFVPSAIQLAQARAQALPSKVAQRLDFRVADGLEPAAFGQPFGAIFDSGFYHLFDAQEGAKLVANAAQALLPQGRYYLHAFDVDFPGPNLPRRVTSAELESLFSAENGWRILALQSAEFISSVAPPAPAVIACAEDLAY